MLNLTFKSIYLYHTSFLFFCKIAKYIAYLRHLFQMYVYVCMYVCMYVYPYVSVLAIFFTVVTVWLLFQITHTKTNTNIHARGRIRTRNPLDQASRVRPCLYALSHPDRQGDRNHARWARANDVTSRPQRWSLQPWFLHLQ